MPRHSAQNRPERRSDGVPSSDHTYDNTGSAPLARRTDLVRRDFGRSAPPPVFDSSNAASYGYLSDAPTTEAPSAASYSSYSYPSNPFPLAGSSDFPSLPGSSHLPFQAATSSSRLPSGFETTDASYGSGSSRLPSGFETTNASYGSGSSHPPFEVTPSSYRFPAGFETTDASYGSGSSYPPFEVAYRLPAGFETTNASYEAADAAEASYEAAGAAEVSYDASYEAADAPASNAQYPLETYHNQELMEQDYPKLAGLNLSRVLELGNDYKLAKRENRLEDENTQANAYLKRLYQHRKNTGNGQRIERKERKKLEDSLKAYHNQEFMELRYPNLKGLELKDVIVLKNEYYQFVYIGRAEDAK